MKVNKYLIYICFVFVSCSGIQKKEFSVNEYVSWFEANSDNFKISKRIGDITYAFTYIPHEYLTAKHIQQYQDTIVHADSTLLTFYLRVSTEKGNIQEYRVKDIEEFSMQEQYLSFNFQNDIFIMYSDTLLSASHVIYQSGKGLAPYIDFVVHFDIPKYPQTDFQIRLDDKVWSSGRLHFYFNKKTLSKRPILKI